MSTCNRLDLETLGSQPMTMPKNLTDHWRGTIRARTIEGDESPQMDGVAYVFDHQMRA